MSSEVQVRSSRRIVVTALPLSRAARARLAELLDDCRVVDIRESVDAADLVLAPSCSPQAIAALKDAFPGARLVVVEIEDWDFNIDLPGPVKRLLAAGADGYITSDNLEDLATQLRPSPSAVDDQVEGADQAEVADQADGVDELPTAAVDGLILSALSDRLAGEQHVVEPGRVERRPDP